MTFTIYLCIICSLNAKEWFIFICHICGCFHALLCLFPCFTIYLYKNECFTLFFILRLVGRVLSDILGFVAPGVLQYVCSLDRPRSLLVGFVTFYCF